MKKIIFCVNHSFGHIGGCEKVIQQLSEGFVKNYNYKCIVYSRFLKTLSIENNGVIYKLAHMNPDQFMKQINDENADHLFIYDDQFFHFETILKNIQKINCKKSIALVGMNKMKDNKNLFNEFKVKNKEFNIITHSDNYFDYKICKDNDIPVTVISNGIDFSEMVSQDFSFREKYKITTKKIILCVNNFFPGKGQEFSVQICDQIYGDYKDFTIVFICSTVNMPLANILCEKLKNYLKNRPYKSLILQDISRKDTIQSFFESDVFLLTSVKEVSPLVILESMACGLPWISLPVGNTKDLLGGIIINTENRDLSNNYIYSNDVISNFSKNIKNMFFDENLINKLKTEGKILSKEKYNIDIILKKYHSLFFKE